MQTFSFQYFGRIYSLNVAVSTLVLVNILLSIFNVCIIYVNNLFVKHI
jgi:hypothetical protein